MKIFEELKKRKHEQMLTIEASDCQIEDQLEKNGVLTAFYFFNNGYGSIRSTQKSYFNSRYYASSEEGGLTLPPIKGIAQAYGIDFWDMVSSSEMETSKLSFLNRLF